VTRVMNVMAGAAQGGAEAFFTRLAVALADTPLDTAVLIRPDRARQAAFKAKGIPTYLAPFGGFFDWQTPILARRALHAFRPDIVVTWMNRASAKLPPSPAVHVARLGGYYDLKHYRHADHLVGNTRGIVTYLKAAGVPEDRCHYLPNFVDSTAQPPVSRAELGTPGKAPVILALGRLHHNKAFDILIRALARLPEAILWLAGEGPERQALERLAAQLGVAARIRWLGWRTDVPALCAAANVLACPSRIEPLGNVVLEAWAHGLPVVAAKAAGPMELIQDGDTGLLVGVDNADALAEALYRVLASPDLRRGLSEAAREAHRAEFSESAVVGRWLTFFEQVKRR